MIKNVLFVVTVFFFICPSFAQMTRNDSIILSDQLFAKGVEFYNSDRIYEAIPLFQKCDSIDEALNYRLPYAKMWLANCLKSHSAEAQEIYPDYYMIPPIDRRLTTLSDSLVEIAESYITKNQWKNAEKILKKVARIENKVLGDSCFYYANTLYYLGLCQLNQKKETEGVNNLIKAKCIYQIQEIKSTFPVLSDLLKLLYNFYLSSGQDSLAKKMALEESQNLRNGIFKKLTENDYREWYLTYDQIDSIYKQVIGEFCVERAILYNDWASDFYLLLKMSENKGNWFVEKYNIDYNFALDFSNISLNIWNKIPIAEDNEKYYETLFLRACLQKNNNQDHNCSETMKKLKTAICKIKDRDTALFIKGINLICSFYEGEKPDSVIKYLEIAKNYYPDTLPKNSEPYLDILGKISSYYLDNGEDDKAFQLKLEEIDLKSKNEKEKIDEYILWHNIFIFFFKNSYRYQDLQKHLKYLEKKRQLIEKYYGKNSGKYAETILLFSDAYIDYGKFSQAIESSLYALEFYSNNIPIDSANIAHCYRSLIDCYSAIGNKKQATYYREKYADLLLKQKGKYNREYINILISLGAQAINDNDTLSADNYLRDALDISTSMDDEYGIIEAFSWMRWLDVEKSNNDTIIINNSISSIEDMISKIDSNVVSRSTVYLMLTALCKKRGDWLNAINYYKTYINNDAKVGNTISSNTLISLADMYGKIQLNDSATYYTLKAYDIGMKHIQEEISNMTSAERETFWNDNNSFFSRKIPKLAFMCKNDTLTRIAYNSALVYKGFLLSTDIELYKMISESGDSLLLKNYLQLRDNKEHLKMIKEGKIVSENIDIEQFEREIREKESQILKQSKVLGDFTRNMTLTWRDVEKSLKNNEVAIEFTGFLIEDKIQYVAFVLRKGYKAPKMVPLCSKNDLLSIGEDKYYQTSKLYEIVWKPLERYFDGCDVVYFTPEGVFYRIAIESALANNGKTMEDNYCMYRLSSTRELVKNTDYIDNKKSVLYGGLQYTLNKNERDSIKKNYYNTVSTEIVFRDMPNIRNIRECMQDLEPLPGTKKEVEDIAEIMKKNKWSVALEKGIRGTEESFKMLSGKRVNTIHIATHGFYEMEDSISEVYDGREDNSLSRSGLMMSGASDYLFGMGNATGMEDGILTAKEISKLDLRGLNLVALSACKTALGDISSEGVSGLQRGFKKAGAKSILMSLWKVDDEATCFLMKEFYKQWIEKGKTKYNALKIAKEEVRSHKEKKWDDPKYWAAFIMLDGIEK